MKALYWIALIFVKALEVMLFAIMFFLFCISFVCEKISEALNAIDRIALSLCSLVADFLVARDKYLKAKIRGRK